jgi:hypothetical protein
VHCPAVNSSGADFYEQFYMMLPNGTIGINTMINAGELFIMRSKATRKFCRAVTDKVSGTNLLCDQDSLFGATALGYTGNSIMFHNLTIFNPGNGDSLAFVSGNASTGSFSLGRPQAHACMHACTSCANATVCGCAHGCDGWMCCFNTCTDSW